MKPLLLLPFLLLLGCATPQPDPGPVGTSGWKVVAVDKAKAIYRSNQPPDNSAPELLALGVTNVLKLNMDSEWTDYHLTNALKVIYLPIDQKDILVGPVPQAKLDAAMARITGGTLVHCTYGQDRTGLIVALYRLKTGWTRADAEKEMLEHGFHKTLLGLWRTWHQAK